MRDRSCQGCRKQEEFGCTALRWRHPDPDEPDDRSNWIRPAHLPTEVDGEEVWSCPRQDLHQNPEKWGHMLKYYGMYKKGFLPNRGAVEDQSNKAIELFRILDDANASCDATEEQRAQVQRNRPPPTGRR